MTLNDLPSSNNFLFFSVNKLLTDKEIAMNVFHFICFLEKVSKNFYAAYLLGKS